MSTVKALAEIVNFPKNEAGVTRENWDLRLEPRCNHPRAAHILAKAGMVEASVKTAKEREKIKARKIAVNFLIKKKTIIDLIRQLTKADVPVSPVIAALVNVASGINPGEIVTLDQLKTAAGEKPEDVTERWWRSEFALICDSVGFTVLEKTTERRYAELNELEYRCSLLLKCCEDTGNLLTSAGSLVVGSIFSQLTTKNPYIEEKKNGDVVVHLRPHETPEGKEAMRKADHAEFIAKQKSREDLYNKKEEGDHGQLQSFRPWLIGAGVAGALVLYAMAQPGEHPQQPVVTNFNAAAIATEAGNQQ